MNNVNTKKQGIDQQEIQQIMREVPYEKGFHFFTAIGQYTGETATSIVALAKTLQVIEIESVNFHFKRQNLQKWIKDLFGYDQLAQDIENIDPQLCGEKLRAELVKTVQTGLSQIQTNKPKQNQPHSKQAKTSQQPK